MTHADLLIYQGDDWAAIVNVTNEDGTPADITGYQAQAQIRRAVADEDTTFIIELGALVVPPDRISITIPHTQTTLLDGQYVWDLQLVTPGQIITTILAGKVRVTQEVTRYTLLREMLANA